MSKHTPKPWHVVNAGKHWNNPSITNYRVQTGPYDIAYSPDDELVAEHVYEESDARLIAAAPDLLEALQCLYALVKGECPSLLEDDHHDAMVRAAIAKAEGL